ncbi:MAG: HAMP domain-containing histidine kinase, partial [Myxococcales bacterium]|nr:HAMP domain-containing histidine kinase [Myxococcales bacterium]
ERGIRTLAQHVREHRPGQLLTVAAEDVPTLAASLRRLQERYADIVRREASTRGHIEQSQREKTLLMARLTHDLRSPLNAILGFSDLLLMDSDGRLNDAQRESVMRVVSSGRELLGLLNDVLDEAKFEAGRLEFRPQWTPLVEILTDAVAAGRQLLVEKPKVEIVAEVQPGLPAAYVDSPRVVQALVGLFRHSVRLMDEGKIHLWARMGKGPGGAPVVLVDVRDTSPGIRSEDRERIFEAFSDVASASGRRIGGLGVGLALARNLVCAHGGDVRCENVEDQGTTFTVSLPISNADHDDKVGE